MSLSVIIRTGSFFIEIFRNFVFSRFRNLFLEKVWYKRMLHTGVNMRKNNTINLNHYRIKNQIKQFLKQNVVIIILAALAIITVSCALCFGTEKKSANNENLDELYSWNTLLKDLPFFNNAAMNSNSFTGKNESSDSEISKQYNEYKTGETVSLQISSTAQLNIKIAEGYTGISNKNDVKTIFVCKGTSLDNANEDSTLGFSASEFQGAYQKRDAFANAMFNNGPQLGNTYLSTEVQDVMDSNGKEIKYFVEIPQEDKGKEEYTTAKITSFYISDDDIVVYATGSIKNATDSKIENFVKNVWGMATINNHLQA